MKITTRVVLSLKKISKYCYYSEIEVIIEAVEKKKIKSELVKSEPLIFFSKNVYQGFGIITILLLFKKFICKKNIFTVKPFNLH